MNSKGWDLNLLRIFEAVYDERNVSHAATRLGMSQPAVSGALKRLSAELGEPLFQRVKGGVAPTPRAEKLIGPVRDALHALATAVRATTVEPEPDAPRTFRVAMFNLVEPVLLPPVLNRLEKEAPNVVLDIMIKFAADGAAGLIDGTLDLLFNAEPADHEDLNHVDIPTAPTVCVTSRNWTDRHGPLSEGAFLKAGRVAIHLPIPDPDRKAVASLDAGGKGAPDVFLVSKGWSVPNVVANSDLVALLPAGFARAVAPRFGLEIHPAPIDLPLPTLRMTWHRRAENDPLHTRLREMFIETIQAFRARSANQATAANPAA